MAIRGFVTVALPVMLAAGWMVWLTGQTRAAHTSPAITPVNAQQFIGTLVDQVGNKDPRIRLAVREALVSMGAQVLPALTKAKGAVSDPHVRDFIDRIVRRLKRVAKRSKGGLEDPAFLEALTPKRDRDIDRIAATLNLTFEQMTNLAAILEKYDRDVRELFATVNDAAGFTDPDALADLQEAMKQLQATVKPRFTEFLDESQARDAMRYLRGTGYGGLPVAIATGLSPSVIARAINEALARRAKGGGARGR